MKRTILHFAISTLALILMSVLLPPAAGADFPDPSKTTVLPADQLLGVVLSPDSPSPIAASIETITVRDSYNVPVPGAYISIEFPAPTSIRQCTTSQNTGITNNDGVCVITLRGGGCQRTSGSVFATLVKVNGVTYRAYYNAKSPDFDGAGANGVVDLGDLLLFANPGPAGECHDYDNNMERNLGDTLIFSPAYAPRHTCALIP